MANCQGIGAINSLILKGFLMDKALDLKRMIHRSITLSFTGAGTTESDIPDFRSQELFGQKWPLYNFKTF